MHTSTELVESINRTPYKLTYDEHCKRILSNKQILAKIIKECV